MAEPGVFEVMYTTRSLRRLKPDPVPDEVIYRILDAAIRAPSGGNTQHWRFLVVKDPQIKQQVQQIYQKGWSEVQAMYRTRTAPAHMAEEKFRRLLDAAAYLADHLAEVPVLLFACLQERPLPAHLAARLARLAGSSIYPAVQNILLACRALGLGATLTTVSALYEEELKAVLGLPADVSTYALIPIGYPRGKFGPVQRVPVEEVTCVDRWGTPFTRPT
ncbi:MAG: nitroreductase family protein [Candidatus Binatia bacterium]|nr:nitroreductase family protein [Candidatus Binatia bacterium]